MYGLAEFNICQEFIHIDITGHIPEQRDAVNMLNFISLPICNGVSRHFICVKVAESKMELIVGNDISPLLWG